MCDWGNKFFKSLEARGKPEPRQVLREVTGYKLSEDEFDMFFNSIFGESCNEEYGQNDVYNILYKAFMSKKFKL